MDDRPQNFRDVGEVLGLWLSPSPMPSGHLLRGGKLDALTRIEEIGDARTIVNLRRGPDPEHLGAAARVVHLPAEDTVENYDTSNRRVRTWLGSVLQELASPETRWPVYVHCTAGRDRTGVVIAAALTAAGIPREAVIGEYLLSNGALRPLIEGALHGLPPISDWVDTGALRKALRLPA